MESLLTRFTHCSIDQDLQEISNLFSGVKLNDKPKLYNYLTEDFEHLAQEYHDMMNSLDQNQFHMVFDPKPDVDIFSDPESNAELVDYLNKDRKGYTMLCDLIRENFPQYVILDTCIVESIVDYYIECIQIF
tara:strand:+ start:3096 stop:3491 length:396 start_codon:yes stop_codon:yes gene_type:complete